MLRIRFLQTLRLGEGKRLLQHTDKSISEISHQLDLKSK